MRKTVCRGMMLILLAGFLSLTAGQNLSVRAANTSGSFDERISQLKKKFPAGKYWNHMGSPGNNPDGYTDTPCFHHGNCGGYSGACGCNSFNGVSIQCMGFAEKLGFDMFGTNPRTEWGRSYNPADIRPGDIVRYRNHSIFVTGVSGDIIIYADCNSDGHCVIRWDASIHRSALYGLSYIQHANNYDSVSSKKNIARCRVRGIKASYAYTGRAITPKVTIKDGRAALKKGRDYRLTYKKNISTGKAFIKIEGKGSYEGRITRTFRIVPKKGVLYSLTPIGAGRVRVKWEKDRHASGYAILISEDRSFKKSRWVKAPRNSAVSWCVKRLEPGKRYYMKIRSYKLIDQKERYGACSPAKMVVCE